MSSEEMARVMPQSKYSKGMTVPTSSSEDMAKEMALSISNKHKKVVMTNSSEG